MKHSQARSKESIEFAKSQRSNGNEFSDTVWQWLRNRKLLHQKFRREYPIPPYTVDFCCVELKLIIEVDGESHFTVDGLERDRVRDSYLNDLGFKVLRIPGYDVIRDPDLVHKRITEFVRGSIE